MPIWSKLNLLSQIHICLANNIPAMWHFIKESTVNLKYKDNFLSFKHLFFKHFDN